MADIEIFILTGIIITILFVSFIVSFLLINQKRHYRYIREKEEIKNEFAQTLLQAQLEIKEQTLNHIAYELHDNLGQIASLIKINLNTLGVPGGPQYIQKIEDTKELLRQLIADLKSLSLDLNSDRIAELGLVRSLQLDSERLSKTGEFQVAFDQEGNIPLLDRNTTMILYRMSQEIISNIIKHSGSKQISISMNASHNLLKFAITDVGIGFDKGRMYSGSGSGLINLENRAKLIKAKIFIDSTIGVGTRITIELPL